MFNGESSCRHGRLNIVDDIDQAEEKGKGTRGSFRNTYANAGRQPTIGSSRNRNDHLIFLLQVSLNAMAFYHVRKDHVA